MKYQHYYIPFFGPIIVFIENNNEFFDYKNPHFWTTGILHGAIWGITLAS